MKKIIWFSLLSVLLAGLIIAPETPRIPVSAATPADWNPHSFWYYPWGKSGVHKGIDIFAKKGQPVLASTSGWVVSKGYDELGGNYALIWSWQARLHYYAHLDTVNTCEHCWIKQGASIGTVGDSGNAKVSQRICTMRFTPLTRKFGYTMLTYRKLAVVYSMLIQTVS